MKMRRRMMLAGGLGLTAGLLVACGGSGGDVAPVEQDSAAARPSSTISGREPEQADGPVEGLPEPCLSEADITAATGLEMRVVPEGTQSAGDRVVCAYGSADQSLGAFVSILVGPADEAEQAMNEMRSAVEVLLGTDAAAEPVDVGDGGLAFGSDMRSAALATSAGRLYLVDITSTGASIGEKKDAVVGLLTSVIG